jgi:photosystem II stability/assembly factor-like uncharacterized protein
MLKRSSAVVLLTAGLLAAGLAHGQFDESLLKNMVWRNVGPVGAGGRITSIAVAGDFPFTIYAGTHAGGVFKTTNNAVTWEPVFDHESTSSIGAIAVDPANPDLVWVGTGEANPRNNVSWGDGIFKSTDGGKNWKNMGLRETHHIGRVLIDPHDSNIVYVAAAGHTWGANKERGLYKTTDGGLTWTNTLFIDQDTGFIDVAMDPKDSNILYAASWQRQRDAFAGGEPAIPVGPGSGIYKTTDGGRNWKKLTNTLPQASMGRIGLDISRSNPNVVYAIIQTASTAAGPGGGEGGRGGGNNANARSKTVQDGGVFRSDDRGETWRWMNPINPRPMYYSQIRVDPENENRVYILGNPIYVSDDSGKTFRELNNGLVHVDHHALWINPKNPKHMLAGNDGGLYISYDRGATWDFNDTMPLSQFYQVDVDMRKPYWIYGGVQDFCTWGGPSQTRNLLGIEASDWFKLLCGDGFQIRIDPTDYTTIYPNAGSSLTRYDLTTGRNVNIRPRPAPGAAAYRFNWETPMIISPHDPKTIYYGGNVLFKSTDRGDSWTVISPDLSVDQTGTLTTITESPSKAGLLYAGTDDGNVHISRDGGKTWTNITNRFPGMPGRRWVSRIVASSFEDGVAYASFDGHRNEDYAPHLYRTADFGDTWSPIHGNLPADDPVRVIREDLKNRDLLFVGTEHAAYVSIDRGAHWVRLTNGMPTVPVADLVIHPRDEDLIAGTHGRSVYVVDISSLQQLTPKVLNEDVHLFDPKPAVELLIRAETHERGLGDKRFVARNPPYGATLNYYLKSPVSEEVKITILDKSGKRIRELPGPKERGIHPVQWDLCFPPPPSGGTRVTDEEEGAFRESIKGPLVAPGDYTVRLTVGQRQWTSSLTVEADALLRISGRDQQTLSAALQSIVDAAAFGSAALTTADSLYRAISPLANSAGISAALKSSLEDAAKQLTDVRNRLRRMTTRTGGLYNEVNGSPFPPTVTQTRELAELNRQADSSVDALNDFILAKLPGIVSQIRRENAQANPIPAVQPIPRRSN